MANDYYLGLDIGTDSVGWAVTDEEYRIPKFKGNAMWGIRLFEESKTAEERRMFRTSRRRTQRRRERLNLLEMLFDEEISKKDIAFFQRFRESNLYLGDKTSAGKYCVFNDRDYTDKNFHTEYPTVYHLRKELIENPAPHDARLVFIALHHIIKNRGHFLSDSLNVSEIRDFSRVYDDLEIYLDDNYDIKLNCSDVNRFSDILRDKNLNKTKKKSEILKVFNVTKKAEPQICAVLSLLSGTSENLYEIFDDETLKDIEKKKITLSGNFDEAAPEYESILGEQFELIEKLKAIYDWAELDKILEGHDWISDYKIGIYNKHHDDLKLLKDYVRERCPEKYREIFKISKKDLDNYVAYSGHVKKSNGRTSVLNSKDCNQEKFCAYLKKLFSSDDKTGYEDMFARIENGTFMPKQVSGNNSIIPMQIHRAELVKILDNAKEYLSFLNDVDENGISVSDKIISIFNHRIPYYVGILNTHSENSHWLVRSDEKIYPWNFEDIIDLDKSADAFIRNLTSKCTYFPQYDVIPKNSILYSKYMVLSELNNIKIDGNRLGDVLDDVNLKQDIFNDLFLKYNKVRLSSVVNYLRSRGKEFDTVSGIDGDFKSSMKPLRDLKPYNLSYEDMEEIITSITVLGDNKKRLRARLRANFSDKLTEDEILKISKLKYTGWSRLSKEFLTDVECMDKKTGEVVNIITALWQTNDNLMEILYSENYKPTFNDAIKKLNAGNDSKSMREMVDELYVSPKVKRPIHQALLIAKEIEKIQKRPPKKIFIEVTRGGEKEKKRKASRKSQLIELYKKCHEENSTLFASLMSKDDSELRSDKLFFYYSQFGKCMYTEEPIDPDLLMRGNTYYDIDHIYPKSKIKDDSLNNRVLVKRTVNQDEKKAEYPLSDDIQSKMKPYWKWLLNIGAIEQSKYDRLVRKEPLSDDELYNFIARQLVETAQASKAVAGILGNLCPKTEIVYVKSSLVSDFRQKYKTLKCRDVNDYHHAKDAYLNIVVGNVYNVKVTHDRANFIDRLQRSEVSLNAMFNNDIKGAWSRDKSIKIVKDTMKKNNIRYTRYAFERQGGLFDRNPVKKKKDLVSLKKVGAVSDTSKYGGYTGVTTTYFCCVEYGKENKRIRSLCSIDLIDKDKYEQNPILYIEQKYELLNPKIIVAKIKVQSCFSFDGFRTHLSCKDDDRRTCYRPAIQLVLSYNEERYIKNVFKFVTDKFVSKIDGKDSVTKAENENLYKALTEKFGNKIYGKMHAFSELHEKLLSAENKFKSLSLEEQCKVLSEMVKILQNNAVLGDLKLIGISPNGKIRLNNNISKLGYSSVKLINQSVTGLYEQEVELLK